METEITETPTLRPLTTQGAKCLLKLAKFLREMPRAKFNFSVIMNVYGKPPLDALKAGEHRCGTAGCAIGWMPAVWPKQLKWDRYNSVRLIERRRSRDNFGAAEKFFGISHSDALHLFNPNNSGEDDAGNWRDNNLPYDASPKRVAAHIRRFVKERYAGKARLSFK